MKKVRAMLFAGMFMVLLLSAFPLVAGFNPIAGTACGTLGIPCSGTGDTAESLADKIGVIISIGLTIAGVIAGAFFIIGGIKYITSAGDESQAAEAKRTLLYVMIGLIVIGLSLVTVNFVMRIF